MLFQYTLKARGDLTEADLPRIEAPFFAREDVRSASRRGMLDLPALLYRRRTPWEHYGEAELMRDLDEGEVFAVCAPWRTPLRPLFRKVGDPAAPNGARWEVDKFALSGAAWLAQSKLQMLLQYELPQRERRQARSQPRATAAVDSPRSAAVAGGKASAASSKVAPLFLQLHCPPSANASSRYTLRGAQGFSAEKTPQDDKIAGNDTLDFEFTQVPVDATYALTVTTGQEEVVLFSDIEFQDIRRQVIR